jgi:hypothetical protein
LHLEERRKRQATTPAAPILPPNSGEPPDPNRPPHLGEDDTIIFFEPYVFLNQINEHVLLDGLIMSPHAFVNELVLAETLPVSNGFNAVNIFNFSLTF